MKLGFLSGTPELSLVAQLVDPLRVAPESRMLASSTLKNLRSVLESHKF